MPPVPTFSIQTSRPGSRKRQRPQQHRVDDAEHGRTRADAECQGEERDGGEARGLGQLANGEPEIGHHGLLPV
jgi:hypothetical protein